MRNAPLFVKKALMVYSISFLVVFFQFIAPPQQVRLTPAVEVTKLIADSFDSDDQEPVHKNTTSNSMSLGAWEDEDDSTKEILLFISFRFPVVREAIPFYLTTYPILLQEVYTPPPQA